MEKGPLFIGVLSVFGGVFLISAFALIWLVLRSRAAAPRFESHWGGLGRGLGGWTMNGTMVLSILALLSFGGFVGLAIQTIPQQQESKKEDPPKKQPPQEAKNADPALTVEISNIQSPASAPAPPNNPRPINPTPTPAVVKKTCSVPPPAIPAISQNVEPCK